MRWICVLCCGFVLGLAGCGSVPPRATVATKSVSLAGQLKGGQQGVSGGSIQLYAVGTTGDGSVATPLLTTPVVSGATGNFDITGDYTCPSADTLVYLTATGGNPGLAAGSVNPALVMMAALGPCGQLSQDSFILVNELTTVGSMAALYPYTSGVGSIGSGSGDAGALTTAFAAVNEYTSVAYGTVPGPTLPSGYYASSVEIATLADILSTCVDTTGGVAGDGSACGNLFHLAQPSGGTAPTDVLQALVDILNNPTNNVSALFNMTPAQGAPFQPSLNSAPTNWTLPILQIPGTPTFSEPAGIYRGNQTISVNESVSSAVVHYTVDGTTPTPSSTVYSGPITVSSPTTVNAIAINAGRVTSGLASARYLVAPVADPPAVTSVTPQTSGGTPNSVIVWGNFEFVSVQGTGQIFTYDLSTGYQLLAVPAYKTSCTSPSGMVVTTINGENVMAVVCYDTGSLLTLAVGADGSLSALGQVVGLPSPYPGIVLVGTNVYVALYGAVYSANGAVAKVSLATPSAPVMTATTYLVGTQAGFYANPAYIAESNGYLYVTAGSEGNPQDESSSIQVLEEDTMALVGTPFLVAHSPQQVAVSGHVLYTTIYDEQQLESIDISDPANLVVLQTLSMPDCTPEGIVLSGNTAYVGGYGVNRVFRVDISDPTNMVEGSTQVAMDVPQRLVMNGSDILVTSAEQNGEVVEINPATAF